MFTCIAILLGLIAFANDGELMGIYFAITQ